MAAAITATPPTTPPAMAPVFELPPPGSGVGDPVEDGLREYVGVVDTPEGTLEGLMSEPGPASGVSIKTWSETVTRRKDRRDDAHHQRNTICLGSNRSRSAVL
jgi:hypothetical protein